MRHEQIIDHFSDYIEGSLDAAMCAAVELHIKSCATCYQELAALRKVYSALFNSHILIEPPGRFHDDVMRKVRLHQQDTTSTQGFFSRLHLGWVASAAGGVAAVALALSLAGPTREPASSAGVSLNSGAKPDSVRASEDSSILIGRSGSNSATGRYTIAFRPTQTGRWRVTADTSDDVTFNNTLPLSDSESRLVWQGEAASSRETFVILEASAEKPAPVSEMLVTLDSPERSSKTHRLVIAPLGTRNEGAPGSLPLRPDESAHTAARVLSSAYGATIVAPVDALERSVTISINPTSVDQAVEELARALGLRYMNYRGVYNLIPETQP